ncbi:MAG: type IV secretory system conjugative DNA transfer family protein [Hyphomicrobiales bacterium]|nr:type IV secretory system conjugative DNA transfer family protein [Hyphomicrobiales bacterium]
MERNYVTLGTATNHYSDYPVALSTNARLRHLFIIGQTGTGKTTLLQNMACSDLEAGEGFSFFDPHGDAARELLEYIPPHRMRDVIYLRPADTGRAFGYNILANVLEKERDRVTQEVVSTFRYRWVDSWGARMENIFKHTVRALLDAPARHGSATLLSVPLMLNRKPYRQWVLKHSQNRGVIDSFGHEFGAWNPRQVAEFVQPILNKVDQFLLSDVVRNVIGQAQSTINLDRLMDDRKVVILDLDKGAIGADDANTIGSLLLTGFQLAAMRRSKRPPEERTPFYCYLDEFHSFTTGSFASIMSESRKYGLGLVLAGQYLDQIEIDQVRASVFGNCGNFCSFRVSTADAADLADTLNYRAARLEALRNGHAAVRYLHRGHPRTDQIETYLLDPDDRVGRSHSITKYSERYTTPTELIDRRMIKFLNFVQQPRGKLRA